MFISWFLDLYYLCFFLTFFIYFILFFNFLFICFSQTYQNDSEGTGQPRGVSIFP